MLVTKCRVHFMSSIRKMNFLFPAFKVKMKGPVGRKKVRFYLFQDSFLFSIFDFIIFHCLTFSVVSYFSHPGLYGHHIFSSFIRIFITEKEEKYLTRVSFSFHSFLQFSFIESRKYLHVFDVFHAIKMNE